MGNMIGTVLDDKGVAAGYCYGSCTGIDTYWPKIMVTKEDAWNLPDTADEGKHDAWANCVKGKECSEVTGKIRCVPDQWTIKYCPHCMTITEGAGLSYNDWMEDNVETVPQVDVQQ